MSLTGDALTDWLVPLATRLAGAVKEDDRKTVAAVLNEVREEGGRIASDALAIVLAAMVPDDMTGAELLSWMRNPQEYLRLRHNGVGFFAASRMCTHRPPVEAA